MSQPTSFPTGVPCWIDLFTTDPDASIAFYGELFGWVGESAGDEFGGYINFELDGRRVAGAMRNDGSAGMPDAWNIYLSTDDADVTAKSAMDHGATVFVPPMPVGDLGSMMVMADPGQAAIGAWQPGTFPGFGVLDEPGAPSWFELHTRDYDAAVTFYREVFAWDAHVASDVPEFRYTTLGEGEEQRAGIMDAQAFLPEGVPATWQIYFEVVDADATLARIVELGGAVVDPAEDSPYGRLAGATDPTGARFKLRQLPS